MAHFETSISTSLSPADAFAKMADMTRFAEWDPGVVKAKQITGTEPGLGAAYILTVKGIPKPVPLKYVVKEFEDTVRYRAVAEGKLLRSDDIVTVAPSGEGSIVTYEADLFLQGPLRILDFALGPIFNRIGNAADKGMKSFLNS